MYTTINAFSFTGSQLQKALIRGLTIYPNIKVEIAKSSDSRHIPI